MKRVYYAVLPCVLLLFFCVSFRVFAQAPAPQSSGGNEIRSSRSLFPALYFSENLAALRVQNEGKPYGVSSYGEIRAAAQANEESLSLLLNNDILAYYGHPNSKNMGILGRYSIEELDAKLTALAAEYESVSKGRKVRKAFYIIYGTVWPEGEIGILKDETVLKYIRYGLENDILVFLDHQIGRYDPIGSLKKLLPWLQYPNVHLALDPEWRTTRPMQEIGTVSAEELNQAQKIMEDYIIEHHIPGERLLVIHQFNWRMISDRERVSTAFERVRLVHCADGFGNPHLKQDSYAFNAAAANMPVKGFKLFYDSGIPGAGYDSPLLKPEEVYALNPRPYIIIYQ
ncbi:MAG: hypothetical protein LBR96_01750 [Treponema sp.]|jgi:hypothetical protein|nr:hypothetical protein [Treponema sp.]